MSKARNINDLLGNVHTPPQNQYDGYCGLVYTRVSSKKQEIEGSGLTSQEERCKRDLASIRVPYDRTFSDTYSGGGDFMQRPEMRNMIEYIDKNPNKKFVIVFDDLKRFARDLEFHLKLRAVFKSRGVFLRCLNYQFDDSPIGRLIESISAGAGQLEREQNRIQVIQKQKARLDLGYWAFAPKKGYDMIRDPIHGKISVPNEQGLRVLKVALEKFASGELPRKIDVCHFLVKNKFWTKQKPEKYIDNVSMILRDSFYAGMIEYPSWDVKRRPGLHKGIITLDVFNANQRRLKKEMASSRIRIDTSPDFPLRGLVSCGDCGAHITAAWTRGCNGRFAYYFCQNKSCVSYRKSIKKNIIEVDFEALLERNKMRPELEKLIQLVFDRVWANEMKRIDQEAKDRERKKKELDIEITKFSDLANKAFDNEILRSVYERQIEKKANELKELEDLSKIKTDYTIPYRTALQKSTKLLENPLLIWKEANVFEKHRLFFFLFNQKIPFDRKHGYRTNEISSTVSLFEEFFEQKNDQNTSLVVLA